MGKMPWKTIMIAAIVAALVVYLANRNATVKGWIGS